MVRAEAGRADSPFYKGGLLLIIPGTASGEFSWMRHESCFQFDIQRVYDFL